MFDWIQPWYELFFGIWYPVVTPALSALNIVWPPFLPLVSFVLFIWTTYFIASNLTYLCCIRETVWGHYYQCQYSSMHGNQIVACVGATIHTMLVFICGPIGLWAEIDSNYVPDKRIAWAGLVCWGLFMIIPGYVMTWLM